MFFKKKDNNKSESNRFIYEIESLIEINDVDSAIEKLEKHISVNKRLGKPYTILMNLYNQKLNEARINNYEEDIQSYLKKIDSLMQMSKDIIRGK